MTDTTKTIIITDTLIHHGDTITSTQKRYETKEISESKSIFENVCNCPLISDLIWPFTILIIIAIFYKKIEPFFDFILHRTKKIKVGSFELELERLKQETENVENYISDKGMKFKGPGGEKQPLDFDYNATGNWPSDILNISIEIEKTLREIYALKMTDKKQILAVSVLIETLRENKIIDLELTKLLREFWIFRNSIVHAIKYEVTEKEFLSFADIGIRILKILNLTLIESNDNNIKN